MSEHHEEQWGEMARLSRRVVLVEQMLLRRILALEAEVAALKGQEQGQDGPAQRALARIMDQKQDGSGV